MSAIRGFWVDIIKWLALNAIEEKSNDLLLAYFVITQRYYIESLPFKFTELENPEQSGVIVIRENTPMIKNPIQKNHSF